MVQGQCYYLIAEALLFSSPPKITVTFCNIDYKYGIKYLLLRLSITIPSPILGSPKKISESLIKLVKSH